MHFPLTQFGYSLLVTHFRSFRFSGSAHGVLITEYIFSVYLGGVKHKTGKRTLQFCHARFTLVIQSLISCPALPLCSSFYRAMHVVVQSAVLLS